MKAVRIHETGGPEKLVIDSIDVPKPAAGQAVVKLVATGVNFIDVYHRTGLYKVDLPATLGMEGAGIVESVGPDVKAVKPGDKVAFAMTRGSYAEYIALPAWQLVPVPANMNMETAAAAMLQGMTAHYLTHSIFPLKQGQTCIVHAGAGGVGLILIQMAKLLGARVIATASTDDKRQLATETGADLAVGYEGFAKAAKEFTEGKGVDVIYDGVGKTTFLEGLDALRPRGMMALYGQSSGKVDPIDPGILNTKGSLFLTRPSLGAYSQTRDELLWRAGDVLNGTIEFRVAHKYHLDEAAQAHRDLESRKTTGKLILTI